MIRVLEVNITPNPVNAGDELTIEINVQELFADAKRYPRKYPYRYMGREKAQGRQYPYKYQRK